MEYVSRTNSDYLETAATAEVFEMFGFIVVSITYTPSGFVVWAKREDIPALLMDMVDNEIAFKLRSGNHTKE